MEIAILVFDGITALDAVGPYEVLSRVPGATTRLAAREPGPKRTHEGGLALVADCALSELPRPEIVLIPGGFGVDAVMEEPEVLDWLRAAHASSRWTTSVCTGSLILGAAGLLRGLKATTHWLSLERLRDFGAEPTTQRVVREGKIITAAGVSAGIDMALELARAVAGDDVAQAIQLSIEYDPQPPFDSGSPAKAPPHVAELARQANARARAAS